MIRTLLKYRNPDSTLDLNDQLSGLFRRGIVNGGDVNPTPLQLAVDVSPFKLIGIDGMVVLETSDFTRLAIPAGQTSVVVFKSQYRENQDPIVGFEVVELSTYMGRADKDFLTVFAVIELSPTATQVNLTDIQYGLRDVIDPVGRLNIRGVLASVSLLPSLNNRAGDAYFITSGMGDTPELHVFNGFAFINITNSLTIGSLLAAHRANLFPNEIHLTDEQAVAALGTTGVPGVEDIGVNFVVAQNRVDLANRISNDSLETGKVVRFTTTGSLPSPLTPSTDYYVIKIDDLTFNLAVTPADAALGNIITLSGLPVGTHRAFFDENKYVTSLDPRLPTQEEKDALVGLRDSVPVSGMNPYVSASFALAEPNTASVTATAGPIQLSAGQGPFYVGVGGVGTAAQFFKLYHPTLQREFVDPTTQQPVQIVGVFKDIALTQPLIPNTEPAVLGDNGFFSGALFLSVSSTLTGNARLQYGQKKSLGQIDRAALLRPSPVEAQTTQEAILKFQEISGRLFDTSLPLDEQNINLRIAINLLLRYLNSTTAANLVLARSEFKRLRDNPIYTAEFAPDFNEIEILSGNKTITIDADPVSVQAFVPSAIDNDAPVTVLVRYQAGVDLSSVVTGHLVLDGEGKAFRVLAVNPLVPDALLIYLGQETFVTAVNQNTGKIILANNPRKLELLKDYQTAFGEEFIQIDGIVDTGAKEILPPGGAQNILNSGVPTFIGSSILSVNGNLAGSGAGRSIYQVTPKIQNNRFEDRLLLIGGWNKTQDVGFTAFAQVGSAIEFTGRLTDLIIYTNQSGPTAYSFEVFVDGIYIGTKSPSLIQLDSPAYETYLEGKPNTQPFRLDLGLTPTQLHTVRLEIIGGGDKPFTLSGVGVVFAQGLLEEKGSIFSGTEYKLTDTTDSQTGLIVGATKRSSKVVRYIDAAGARQSAVKSSPYYDDPAFIVPNGLATFPTTPAFEASRLGDVIYLATNASENQTLNQSAYRLITGQAAGNRTIQPITFDSQYGEFAYRVPVDSKGIPKVSAPASIHDKLLTTLKVMDWTVGVDSDISELPLLSQESRVTTLEDGSTSLRLRDCTKVDGVVGDEFGLELSIPNSEMQITAFCSRMDLVFSGQQGPCSVQVEINGSFSYQLDLQGSGQEVHSVFYDANLQTHSVRLHTPAGPGKVVVSRWSFHEIADPVYQGVAITEYNQLKNVKSNIQPDFAPANNLAISHQGLRLFNPLVAGAAFFGTPVFKPNELLNPYFGVAMELGAISHGFTFEFYGSGFELYLLNSSASVMRLNVSLNSVPLSSANFPSQIIVGENTLGNGFEIPAVETLVKRGVTRLPFGFYTVRVTFAGSAPDKVSLLAIAAHQLVGSLQKRNLEDTKPNRLHFSHFRDVRKFLTLEPQQVGLVGAGEGEATQVAEVQPVEENLSPLPTWQAIVRDDFIEVPTSPDSKVNGVLTKATHSFVNNLYRLRYHQSTIVTSVGNDITVANSNADYIVQEGDIVYFFTTNEWRRIVTVTNQTSFSLDAAAPAGPNVMIAQAVWTKDLVNIGDAAEETRLRDIFPAAPISKVLLSYLDSSAPSDAATPIDSVADIKQVANVVVSVSNDGLASDVTIPSSTTFAPAFTRSQYADRVKEYPLLDNPQKERLTAVFFPNPANLSVTTGIKNLLQYDVNLYPLEAFDNAGILNSAYCYNDGSEIEFNCQPPQLVMGKTRVKLGFSFTPNLNPGTPDGDVEVVVDGKIIPRFVAGVTAAADISYTEVNTDTIEFNLDLITATPTLSIHIRKIRGVEDKNQANAARLSFVSNLWVGSAADVAAGFATHQSLQAAVDAATSGQTIFVRSGVSITENVTIAKRITVLGSGYDSHIDGSITLAAGSVYSSIKGIRFNSMSISLGADGNIVNDCFFGTAPVDAGAGNLINGVEI